MSESSRARSADFLRISDQFQLGVLTTESSHPVTSKLSDEARASTALGLQRLFEVDEDVIRKFQEFVQSGRAASIYRTVRDSVLRGGKVFFTGCGSTGRLSIQLVSIWRDFFQQQKARGFSRADDFEKRAHSVMAGGDFALIKAVEGFEDFTEFGKKQIGDLGVGRGDVVFAITEGGETSFVIGTAWKGLESGAKVYFVYNNPDDVLCKHVRRSREVIEEPRIEKINLTTGPMAITGSTRMQATTIQLAVLSTILEMVFMDLLAGQKADQQAIEKIPGQVLDLLKAALTGLKSTELLASLARLVEMEEGIYRKGNKNNYFAQRFGIDVLTDTTERSPTYCTPPFRKFDDTTATESWTFLFVPQSETPKAWEHIIKRTPRCVEWTEEEIRGLVPADKLARSVETVRKISYPELMRFKVGLDGLKNRPPRPGNGMVAVISEAELDDLLNADGFFNRALREAAAAGAARAILFFGQDGKRISEWVAKQDAECLLIFIPVPRNHLLLDGVTRLVVKMTLNALSTCTMVRLGRVMGNYMIWVVPSNLKLIDRSTRYIQRLSGLDYQKANELLFEVIEYVEPRMKADQSYPPVVGVSVMRHRHGLDNAAAEKRLMEELK